MNKRSEYRGPSPVAGISSLLVLFLVLCLVVFACLSLSTARSDYSFSQKNADTHAAYTEACNKAQEQIADYAEKRITGAKSWSVPIDDIRTLEVEVYMEGKGEYRIDRWQTVVQAGEDNGGGTMQLMQLGD